MIFEGGGLKFELVKAWGKIPKSLHLSGDIPGVATDSQDRVYLLNRSEHPVIVFERDGRFLGTWGENDFPGRPHGITITRDDIVWCTDDADHTVRKFTQDGKLLQILGTPGQPSDTGYIMGSGSTLNIRAAGPFNRPTKVAAAINGELYITDGYGNARVHRFTPEGELIQSWGEAGQRPGEFNLPHSVWVHTDGRVFVCDRENSRVQIFSSTGQQLGIWHIKGRPQSMVISKDEQVFISNLFWKSGERTMGGQVMSEDVPSHVGVYDLRGNMIAKWGGTNYGQMDSFVSAHGICLDSHGDMYIVENGQNGLKKLGLTNPSYPSVRKMARLS